MEITPGPLSIRQLAKARAPDPETMATARKFEEMFLAQTVDEMLKSVDTGSFGGGHAEETWRSFLARAFAEQISDQGSTGIAQSVARAIGAYGDGGTENAS
ncbi:MAG: Rod binding domain-containing protein [Limimaricola cinnabarinus]|jgi:Rod binding domain-containing protein|uniref:rod-binding protein n=1 Tax=Limimaricola cinnabarinus TaxID=1125964 RepID=UPI0039E23318